ncbi:unknown [Phocaeicola coprocola CAG:162]|uniref:Uncharacterized protein n=1 Tax=Phocaeicola coprocola CAG:162 TaxID=1263040 RepID=R6CAW8_9BACT|nr:unknown [Phocaeicola coprocola CAG:162]
MTSAVTDGIVDASVSLESILRAIERSIVAQRSIAVDGKVNLRTQVILAVDIRIHVQDTFLVIVCPAHQVFHILRTPAQRDAVLLGRTTVVVHHVPPVVVAVVHPLTATVSCIFHYPRAVGVLRLVVHTGQQLLHVVVGIIHVVRTVLRTPEGIHRIHRPVTGCFVIGSRGRSLPSQTAAVTHGSLSVLCRSRLGCDQNHTECRTRTVYCRSRRILDDRDRLHVVRVHTVQFTHRTVYQHQRTGTVDRSRTTHVDAGRAARHTRRGSDIQTGYRTLQHVCQRLRRTVFQLLAAHRSHGSRQVHLLLRTVTDNHRLIQHDGIFLHIYHNIFLSRFHLHLFGKITHIREIQSSPTGRYLKLEGSVYISNASLGSSVDDDRHPDKRFLQGIQYLTRYCSVLRRQRRNTARQQQQQQKNIRIENFHK